jgi:hypothetical protein
MEDIIKKIEEYQAEHKVRYNAAMAKPFDEIVYELAGVIGAYQSQLEIVKLYLELECRIKKQ